MLGVNNNNNHVMKGKKQGKVRSKKEIKVTYISSPMKVKTSASNFRALVQELTGQYSNVAEETFMEANYGANDVVHHKGSSQQQNYNEAYFPESSTNWFKPDYSDLHSGSSMESMNEHQYDEFFSFDML